ncbi:hypothetical protein COJ07_10205 [Bacillus cereus]|nr:hypothetical protein COJ07_10205 [Bacillus cereus]
MSWYVSREYLCKKCERTYIEEVSTFTVTRKDFGKCPMCGSDIKPLNNQKGNNKFIGKLKKAYSVN